MKNISKTELFEKLGDFISCKNLCSERSGREVENQFEIRFEHGKVFQSYDTPIAVKCNGDLYLSCNHDYSRTTSKYCTQWTGYSTAERRKMLENGSAYKFDL